MSIADEIADEIGADGTVWTTPDGLHIEDIAAERCVSMVETVPTRYTFSDGSYLIASSHGWWTDTDAREQGWDEFEPECANPRGQTA